MAGDVPIMRTETTRPRLEVFMAAPGSRVCGAGCIYLPLRLRHLVFPQDEKGFADVIFA
jgi:hypothetical protein